MLTDALVEPESGLDSHGHPFRLWNAVNGVYFVGVSCNLADESYNCYPEVPATSLLDDLEQLAERSVHDIVGEE